MKMPFGVTWILLTLGLYSVTLAAIEKEKPGHCGHLLAKRELCQCKPYGSDECDDECLDDSECLGQRKCCTWLCKRVCVTPVLRPTVPRVCPPDQEYDYCPPIKQPTCIQPDLNITRPSECIAGCICRPGHVKTGDGKCVPKKQCPPLPMPPAPFCPRLHEIFHACYQKCQPSCANPNAERCVITECVRGCFCAPGFVRNAGGFCVRSSSCQPAPPISPPPSPPPPVCPPDQDFSACRRECEATCLNHKPKNCFRRCQTGCFCKAPYVRDHYGHCVAQESCIKYAKSEPICLRGNELYVVCSKKCQGTCSNPKGENCYSRCVTGCFCKDGYVRHEGDCIPIEQCPPPPPPPPPPTPSTPICEGDFEVYIPCYRGCQKTCENPTGEGCKTDGCITGCFCQDGLVRNGHGHCVRPNQCATLGCGPNEHFDECAPSCPTYCNPVSSGYNGLEYSTAGPVDLECENKPCYSGCICDDGYIKNRTDSYCIPVDSCSASYNHVRCSSQEDPIPCGGLCERECSRGWTSFACPPTCRRRCCRRRVFALI